MAPAFHAPACTLSFSGVRSGHRPLSIFRRRAAKAQRTLPAPLQKRSALLSFPTDAGALAARSFRRHSGRAAAPFFFAAIRSRAPFSEDNARALIRTARGQRAYINTPRVKRRPSPPPDAAALTGPRFVLCAARRGLSHEAARLSPRAAPRSAVPPAANASASISRASGAGLRLRPPRPPSRARVFRLLSCAPTGPCLLPLLRPPKPLS